MRERDHLALIGFIESRQQLPHAWGTKRNDCVSFAVGAIAAATGRRLRLPAGWTTKRGALRVIARLGGLEAAIDQQLPRVAPAAAQRGDVAGVPDPVLGIHPMIVEGDTLVGPGEDGLRRLPRSAMVVAWSATDDLGTAQ